MILKDFECRQCLSRREATVWAQETYVLLWCDDCGCDTEHDSICNGGTKSRYRFNDFSDDPVDYAGHHDSKVTATYYDDKGIEHDLLDGRKGDIIHNRDRWRNKDKQSEHRDRILHKYKKRSGRNKIFHTVRG